MLPEAIPVETNRNRNAVIPKDHSNALVFLDTQVTTMEKLVKVNILHLTYYVFIHFSFYWLLSDYGLQFYSISPFFAKAIVNLPIQPQEAVEILSGI